MKVGDGRGLDVLLAQYLHLDVRVGEVEGEVVQEVGHVGGRPVHHGQGVGGRSSVLLGEGQLQELLGEALHLGRTEAGQLVGVGVQDGSPAVGLALLVHEASVPGARLQGGAADVVVLVGQEGDVTQFESVEVGLVVGDGVSARLPMALALHRAGPRRFRTDRQAEIGSHGLNCFVVRVPDLLGSVLFLMLLLLLPLLQEILLQRQGPDVLVVRPRL